LAIGAIGLDAVATWGVAPPRWASAKLQALVDLAGDVALAAADGFASGLPLVVVRLARRRWRDRVRGVFVRRDGRGQLDLDAMI
jgi:hypothetical protein